jgi:hypothetical protein
MADRQRRLDSSLRPMIPTIDVQIGAAQADGLDADEDVAGSDIRHRDALEREPWTCRILAQSTHRAGYRGGSRALALRLRRGRHAQPFAATHAALLPRATPRRRG